MEEYGGGMNGKDTLRGPKNQEPEIVGEVHTCYIAGKMIYLFQFVDIFIPKYRLNLIKLASDIIRPVYANHSMVLKTEYTF